MKKTYKRLISCILALIMVLTMVPATAFAATLSLSVEGLGVSYEGTTFLWQRYTCEGSEKQISASANGYKKINKAQSSTLTITLTNNLASEAALSFNYTVPEIGSMTIGGEQKEAPGIFSKTLGSGESLEIVITNSTGSGSASIKLTNISLENAATVVSVTFGEPKNGSYTVDGQSAPVSIQKNAMETYSVIATPEFGYYFIGWFNETTEQYISFEPSTELILLEDCTIKPIFIKKGTLFEAGTMVFDELDVAVDYAQNRNISQITLVNDAEIAGSYTIPEGITLLIPFDEAKTLYTSTPTAVTSTSAQRAFKTLTLAEGASITVNGAISVGGTYYAAGGGSIGYMTGPYGLIKMSDSSGITVKNGGALYAWGYVTGTGSVAIESGANVYEWFQIADFRGGSDAYGMNNNSQKVFPISQYYVQNIEAPLTINKGAKEIVYAALYVNKSINSTAVSYIGNDGLFQITSGSMTKRYDGLTDRIVFDVNGEANLNGLSLSLTYLIWNVNLDSSNYVLPITNNVTLNIHSGSKVISNQDVALLPGVEMTIDEGGDLTVATGKNLYVYDADEWGGYCGTYNNSYIACQYAPGRIGSRAELADAMIDVNGTLKGNGSVYTTENGANICSSKGTGVYVQSGSPGTATETYQYQYEGKYISIPVTAAKLHNGGKYIGTENEYTLSSGYSAGSSIYYVNSKWGGTACTHENTEIRNAVDATCTTDGYTGDTYCKDCDELIANGTLISATGHKYTTPEFKWNEDNSSCTATFTCSAGDDSQEVNCVIKSEYTAPQGESAGENIITAYASLEPYDADNEAEWLAGAYKDERITKYYNITFVLGNDAVTQVYAEGTTPDTSTLNTDKDADNDYRYEFTGWLPEVTAVTKAVTYTAQYKVTPLAKYTVTFNGNGGQGEMPSQTFTEGRSLQLPKNIFARDHGTFIGWNTVADGTGIAYSDEGTISNLTKDITLYAQWQMEKYTVTWKNEDGTQIKQDSVEYGTIPEYNGDVPVKEGTDECSYIFMGWNPEVTEVTEDAVYTAVFKEHLNYFTVNLYYDIAGEQQFVTTTKQYAVGAAVKLSAEDIYTTADGIEYVFDHWQVGDNAYDSTQVTLRPSVGGTYDAYACYIKKESEPTAAEPVVQIMDAYAETVNGVAKTAVTLSYTVPEGYSMSGVGFVVSTKNTEPSVGAAGCAMSTSSAKKENADDPIKSGSYTVHINVNNKKTTDVYVRAYMIVKDKDGNSKEIYTAAGKYNWTELSK